ncbi:unnamed protein product [Cuscuta campestris]|uniref:SGNH hydrolase-type esterase domain-containing protein n=1 Tax=Cuscuta campestris TaxID=132261 RepID=A0A484N2X1_9ASTE|nr:unnamed protein product [Cuscuta campestris]
MARPEIVLFGDSITEQSFRSGGWGSSLADYYSRKADILNRGYGGYNTRWALFMLHHLFPLSSAMKILLQLEDSLLGTRVTYGLNLTG